MIMLDGNPDEVEALFANAFRQGFQYGALDDINGGMLIKPITVTGSYRDIGPEEFPGGTAYRFDVEHNTQASRFFREKSTEGLEDGLQVTVKGVKIHPVWNGMLWVEGQSLPVMPELIDEETPYTVMEIGTPAGIVYRDEHLDYLRAVLTGAGKDTGYGHHTFRGLFEELGVEQPKLSAQEFLRLQEESATRRL